VNDIWGLCPGCDEWFACAGWFDRSSPEPVCPTCGEEPRAIANRGITLRIPTSEGLASA
jgi:hypothetical protein